MNLPTINENNIHEQQHVSEICCLNESAEAVKSIRKIEKLKEEIVNFKEELDKLDEEEQNILMDLLFNDSSSLSEETQEGTQQTTNENGIKIIEKLKEKVNFTEELDKLDKEEQNILMDLLKKEAGAVTSKNLLYEILNLIIHYHILLTLYLAQKIAQW